LLHSVYHDHANKDDEWVLRLIRGNAELSAKVGGTAHFPAKLHTMIEATSASDDQANIIRWQPHGRAFKFFDRDRLVSDVLPLYLNKQKKFSSFQRQLNMYGFHKLTGDHDDHGAYYHELFLRGCPALSRLIFRPEKSDSDVRRKFDVTSEPDFCHMPPMPTVSTTNQNGNSTIAPPQLPPPQASSYPESIDILSRQPSPLQQQHQLSLESTTTAFTMSQAQGYCASNIALPPAVPTTVRTRELNAWPEKIGFSDMYDGMQSSKRHCRRPVNTATRPFDISAEKRRNESVGLPPEAYSSDPLYRSTRMSPKRYSAANPYRSTPHVAVGVTNLNDSGDSCNSSISSWEFDLHSAFGGQGTTTAALFRDSTYTSSRLLELHHRYATCASAGTLHPHVPSNSTVHDGMQPSAMAPVALFLGELSSMVPHPLTKADCESAMDKADNFTANDALWNASLDLSHDCGSLYDGSDDESVGRIE
jgi:HSF-type DNA-binding